MDTWNENRLTNRLQSIDLLLWYIYKVWWQVIQDIDICQCTIYGQVFNKNVARTHYYIIIIIVYNIYII